jgi:hypothetical protein
MSTDELPEIKRIVEEHERRIAHLESPAKEKPTKPVKQLSIKEFVLQKRPPTDLDKILVVGYYLERYRNVSPFIAKDLEELFIEAKEPVPANINDAVNKNIEKGYIMDAKKKDSKKAWTLTATGERFVENDLKEEDQT